MLALLNTLYGVSYFQSAVVTVSSMGGGGGGGEASQGAVVQFWK